MQSAKSCEAQDISVLGHYDYDHPKRIHFSVFVQFSAFRFSFTFTQAHILKAAMYWKLHPTISYTYLALRVSGSWNKSWH